MTEQAYKLERNKTTGAWQDAGGVVYASPAQWLFIGLMNGCGCGSSTELGERAARLLKDFARDHEQREIDVYQDPADEILAHWFDSLGFLEHGTSIRGAWLTETGRAVYEQVNQ